MPSHYNPESHHRRSIRLKGHEYAVGGLCFVTICTNRDTGNIILLDRRSSSFTPGKENQYAHQFHGNPVMVMNYELLSQRNGNKYKGNLVVVTDERGVIIQHRASTPWLFDNLEDLRQIPVGAFMDKTCTRVHPTGPKRFY